MYEELKRRVYDANMDLVAKKVVIYTWGKDAAQSVYHAVVMETIAEMALKTLRLNPDAFIDKYVLDKHYFRKHGDNAYYGQ